MVVFLKSLPFIVIILLMGYIFFLREFDNCPECEEYSVFDTSAFLASLPIVYPEVKYIPLHTPIFISRGQPYELPLDNSVDFVDMNNSSSTGYVVVDTIANDTNAFIVIRDTVSEDRIMKRTITDFIIYPSYKVVTRSVVEIDDRRNQVFLGMGAQGGIGYFGLTVELLLITKRNNAYGIGYDPIGKYVAIRSYIRLGPNLFKRNQRK